MSGLYGNGGLEETAHMVVWRTAGSSLGRCYNWYCIVLESRLESEALQLAGVGDMVQVGGGEDSPWHGAWYACFMHGYCMVVPQACEVVTGWCVWRSFRSRRVWCF